MKKIYYLAITALLFVSCSKSAKEGVKETITVDTKEVSMFSNDTKQINLTYSTESLKSKIYTWSSSDLNVANVTAGLVTGVRIGQCYIRVASSDGKLKDSTKITIQPKYFLYNEPYVIFGTPESNILAKETRTLLSQTATGLMYQGENSNVVGVIYLFANNAMTSADVMLLTNTTIADLVANFLNERYQYTGTSNNVYFLTNNKGIIVCLNVDATLGLNVMYIKDTKSISLISMIELYKKEMESLRMKNTRN
jgi:hypothetical protein